MLCLENATSASSVTPTPLNSFMVDIASIQISEFVEISEIDLKTDSYLIAHGNKHCFSSILNRLCFMSVNFWNSCDYSRSSTFVALWIGCICSHEVANIRLLFGSQYLFALVLSVALTIGRRHFAITWPHGFFIWVWLEKIFVWIIEIRITELGCTVPTCHMVNR